MLYPLWFQLRSKWLLHLSRWGPSLLKNHLSTSTSFSSRDAGICTRVPTDLESQGKRGKSKVVKERFFVSPESLGTFNAIYREIKNVVIWLGKFVSRSEKKSGNIFFRFLVGTVIHQTNLSGHRTLTAVYHVYNHWQCTCYACNVFFSISWKHISAWAPPPTTPQNKKHW